MLSVFIFFLGGMPGSLIQNEDLALTLGGYGMMSAPSTLIHEPVPLNDHGIQSEL